MDSHEVPRKLWEHPDPKSTEMYKLMQEINQKHRLQLKASSNIVLESTTRGSYKTFHELYDYSITQRTQFWDIVFRNLDMVYSGSYTRVVDESARMDSIPHWFDGIHINFAENLLYSHDRGTPSSQQSTKDKEDGKIAITEVREGGTEIRNVTWGELRKDVGELSSAMKESGFKKGDRVAIVASNSYDTMKVFCATTALGGMFSSSSTDMGLKGILDRCLQIKPKFIFADDVAVYNGKTIDLRSKIGQIIEGMKDIPEFSTVVAMPRFKEPKDISQLPRTVTLEEYVSQAKTNTIKFEKTSFRDPFMIAYSSGTTGMPKCIVHSIGGVLVSAGKEGKFHRETGPESIALQYTTTGWIMYMSSVLNLVFGCRVILYDGSPFLPDLTAFVKLIGSQKVTKLGISPRYLTELQKNGIKPREIADLSNLDIVTSTGMVLSDQLFEWFYDVGFPKRCHLANISGGTDIAACFGLENPLTPVYVGGLQGPSLGTPISVYDSLIEGGKGVKGAPVEDGTPGELVAHAAFPNMPVFFFGDDRGKKYFSAYFEKYDNVWTHGDFVVRHPITKCLIFLGRADGVLNPSGIRFGSAEIYNVIEASFPQIQDSICVGQRRPKDDDESVMLFLLMKPGEKFSDKLINDIKSVVRKELSPRHVPKYIFETPEIPTTVNLKKVELPVKQIVSGKIIKPSGTLLNPGSLEFYYPFAKVEEIVGPKSKL